MKQETPNGRAISLSKAHSDQPGPQLVGTCRCDVRPKRSRPPCRHSGTTTIEALLRMAWAHGRSRCWCWSSRAGRWGRQRKEAPPVVASELRSDPIRSHGRPLRVRPRSSATANGEIDVDHVHPSSPLGTALSSDPGGVGSPAPHPWPEQGTRRPLSRAVRQRPPSSRVFSLPRVRVR